MFGAKGLWFRLRFPIPAFARGFWDPSPFSTGGSQGIRTQASKQTNKQARKQGMKDVNGNEGRNRMNQEDHRNRKMKNEIPEQTNKQRPANPRQPVAAYQT